MGKILWIYLKLKFTPNTLGCCALICNKDIFYKHTTNNVQKATIKSVFNIQRCVEMPQMNVISLKDIELTLAYAIWNSPVASSQPQRSLWEDSFGSGCCFLLPTSWKNRIPSLITFSSNHRQNWIRARHIFVLLRRETPHRRAPNSCNAPPVRRKLYTKTVERPKWHYHKVRTLPTSETNGMFFAILVLRMNIKGCQKIVNDIF